MITSCQNWGIQGNSAKSTNNPMSSFGLIEENMELSPIYKAVLPRIMFAAIILFSKGKYVKNFI
jgi:hypothetical protein